VSDRRLEYAASYSECLCFTSMAATRIVIAGV